jgi:hypothetical protein
MSNFSPRPEIWGWTCNFLDTCKAPLYDFVRSSFGWSIRPHIISNIIFSIICALIDLHFLFLFFFLLSSSSNSSLDINNKSYSTRPSYSTRLNPSQSRTEPRGVTQSHAESCWVTEITRVYQYQSTFECIRIHLNIFWVYLCNIVSRFLMSYITHAPVSNGLPVLV